MIDKEKIQELKPCPICGSEVLMETINVRKGWESIIFCDKCLLSMNTITYDTEKEANDAIIKKWNTRDKNE